MHTKRATALSTAFVAVLFGASLAVGPRLPETMVTHWNAAGQPDDTVSKFWGQFFVPALTLGVVGLLLLAPRLDPARRNIERFRGLYNDFVVVLTAFLGVTHGVVLAVNLGYDVPVESIVFAGVGLLVVFTGFLLEETRQNWVVGIRTPWTLSDERVWERTHEVGAPLFKLSGLLAVGGAFAPRYGVVVVVGPVLVSSLALVAYSYYLYERRDHSTEPA